MKIHPEDVDFLAHYGVKGMRWGKRKAQTRADPASPEGQAEAARRKAITKKVAIGAAVVAAAGIAVYAGKQGYDYKQHTDALKTRAEMGYGARLADRYGKDSSETFQKGFQFLRSSTVPETGMKSRTYAVAKAKDVKGYREFGGWDIKIETLKDVVSPSAKQQIDTMAETITKADLKKLGEGRSLGGKIAALRANKQQLATINIDKLHNMEFTDAVAGERDKFFDALMSKGFNAIKDEMDGVSAHILFGETAYKYLDPTKQ